MSNIRNLMLSAALVGFAALPAAALNIGTGESTMLTVVPPAASSDTTSTDTTASTDSTGTANTDVLSPDNDKFAGSTVVSADGMKVGAVRAVNMNSDGSMMVFVDLDQTVTSKAKFNKPPHHDRVSRETKWSRHSVVPGPFSWRNLVGVGWIGSDLSLASPLP